MYVDEARIQAMIVEFKAQADANFGAMQALEKLLQEGTQAAIGSIASAIPEPPLPAEEVHHDAPAA